MKKQEVKLQIDVPEGFYASNVRLENGEILYDLLSGVKFKEGDVVTCIDSDNYKCICVFKSLEDGYTYFHCGLSIENDTCGDFFMDDWVDKPVRYATEEEKQDRKSVV